jgi:hypothetical protein
VDPEDVGSGGLGGPYRRDGYVISWIGRLDNLADCVGLGEARPAPTSQGEERHINEGSNLKRKRIAQTSLQKSSTHQLLGD